MRSAAFLVRRAEQSASAACVSLESAGILPYLLAAIGVSPFGCLRRLGGSDSDPTIAIDEYTPLALFDQFPQRRRQLLCLRFGELVAEVLVHRARIVRPARLALLLADVGDEQIC